MTFQKLINGAALVVGLLIAGACQSPPPYVMIDGEFNRESATFLKGVSDRTEVKICYAKNGTTAREISSMAQRECALDGKIAVFREQNLRECPLLTPVTAVYNCVENVSQTGLYKPFN